MSATEQTCEQSQHSDMSHNWEFVCIEHACDTVYLIDWKCDFCKKRKWIAVDPDEPFNQAMYWEAHE